MLNTLKGEWQDVMKSGASTYCLIKGGNQLPAWWVQRLIAEVPLPITHITTRKKNMFKKYLEPVTAACIRDISPPLNFLEVLIKEN